MLIPSLLFFGIVFTGFLLSSKLLQKHSGKGFLLVAASLSIFVTMGTLVALYAANVYDNMLPWLVLLHGLLFFAFFYGIVYILHKHKRK